MQLEEGEITEAAKVRTSKKAIGEVINLATSYAGDRPVRFTVMHAREPKGAARLMEQASAKLNISSSETVDLTLPVAINLGPGTLAVMVMPD